MSCYAGPSICGKLLYLCLKHYNLASTTVTGIPMKEEQNASRFAIYVILGYCWYFLSLLRIWTILMQIRIRVFTVGPGPTVVSSKAQL
jgi:hypothetical protein